MKDSVALVRPPSPALASCELTFLERVPIDVELAARQHARVCDELRALGVEVVPVRAAPEHPDAVFVEDTGVVLDELAVLSRPGAESRQGETTAVAEVLGRLRRLERIVEPGTLDGGDVLISGRRLFVGSSQRTNAAGIAQLRALAEPEGYDIVAVPVTRCLHLLSACSLVDANTLLINREWIDPLVLAGHDLIEVDPGEPFGANAVQVLDTVLTSASFPNTRLRLEAEGLKVTAVEISEFEKAEGGVSCLMLLV